MPDPLEIANRLSLIEAKLARLHIVPNVPVHSFETDKYFRHEMNQGNLTLRLNTDRLKRDFVMIGGGGGGSAPFLLALITGHTAIVANSRYRYDWAEAIFDDEDVVEVSGGLTGTALNLAEWGNIAEPAAANAWYRADVQTHPDFGGDYPEPFNMMPIGGGGLDTDHKIDRAVILGFYGTVQGGYQAYFTRQNAHDGECVAGSS